MSKNKTSKPKVSIVVPAHNVEEFLDKCLDSLTNQTLREIEIICVNDHSEDGTAKILEKWQKKDARVRVLKSEERGPSAARNLGIQHVRSEYLMFCDSDDWFEPTMCEEMLEVIDKNEAGMAICDINFIYQVHKERRLFDEDYCSLRYLELKEFSGEMMSQINVLPMNKIFRMSLIRKYNIRFPVGRFYEDAYFSFAYLCVCKNIYFLDKRLYNYVRRAKSTMTTTWSKDNTQDMSIDHVYVIIEFYNFLKENSLFEEYAEPFWERFRDYVILAIKLSKSKASKKQIQKLVYDFIKSHMEDFAKADTGARSAIIEKVPRLKRTNLPTIKRSVLKRFPTFETQVYNAERLEMLVKKNDQLLKELGELAQSH